MFIKEIIVFKYIFGEAVFKNYTITIENINEVWITHNELGELMYAGPYCTQVANMIAFALKQGESISTIHNDIARLLIKFLIAN